MDSTNEWEAFLKFFKEAISQLNWKQWLLGTILTIMIYCLVVMVIIALG